MHKDLNILQAYSSSHPKFLGRNIIWKLNGEIMPRFDATVESLCRLHIWARFPALKHAAADG